MATPFIHPGFKNVMPSQLGNGVIFVASPGAGKTVIIDHFLHGLRRENEKFFALDVKSEQIQKYGHDIDFLAPWLAGSLVIDFASLVSTESTAQLLANLLMPLSDSGDGRIWEAAANAVENALILELVREKPGEWDLNDLADQNDLSVEEWLERMKRHVPSTAKVLQGAEGTTASVAFNLATSLAQLRTVAKMFDEAKRFGGKIFDLDAWIHEKDYPIRQIILPFSNRYESALGFIIPFIVNYIASQIDAMSNGGNDIKHLVLDEFPQLPRIQSLPKLYEVGRSKGLYTVLATQDWLQVKERYGENVASTIFSVASIKVIGRIAPSPTQAEIAQQFGTKEVGTLSTSQSTGTGGNGAASTSQSYQDKVVPLLLPSQLGSDLGPCHFVKNPNNPTKKMPSKVRAAIQPVSGDGFILDWPVVQYPDRRAAPDVLPSHLKSAAKIRKVMRSTEGDLGDKVRAAFAAAKPEPRQLAGLLFSDGVLTQEEWEKAKKNPGGFLNSLPRAPRAPQARQAIDVPKDHPLAAITSSTERARKPEGRVAETQQPQASATSESDALSDAAGLAVIDSLGGNAHAVELAKVGMDIIDALSGQQAPQADHPRDAIPPNISEAPTDDRQRAKREALRAKLLAPRAIKR